MSKVARYRRRPDTIEADQWTGDNMKALWEWTAGAFRPSSLDSSQAVLILEKSLVYQPMDIGDWVARGVQGGGFFRIGRREFASLYEAE